MAKVLLAGVVIIFAIAVATTGVSWLVKGPPDFFAIVTPDQSGGELASGCEKNYKDDVFELDFSSNGEMTISDKKNTYQILLLEADIAGYGAQLVDDYRIEFFDDEENTASMSVSSRKLNPTCIQDINKLWQGYAGNVVAAQKFINTGMLKKTLVFDGTVVEISTPKVIATQHLEIDSNQYYILSVEVDVSLGNVKKKAYAAFFAIHTPDGQSLLLLIDSFDESMVRTLATAVANNILFR